MANSTSPSTRLIREILADGHWHRQDELVSRAGVLIPPGRAMREREKDRKRVALRTAQAVANPNLRPQRSDDYLIAVGRRRIIVDTLAALTRLEHKTDEHGIRWVRSTPTPKESHHQ